MQQRGPYVLLLVLALSGIALLGTAGVHVVQGAITAGGNGGGNPSGTATCSNYCAGGAASNGCGGSTSISSPSTCYLTEADSFGFATGQSNSISQTGTTQLTYQPQVSNVISYNTYNAPNFLICPLDAYHSPGTLHPMDQSYFYTAPYTHTGTGIAGDACLNTYSSVQNIISLPTSISWSSTEVAQASISEPLSLTNPGYMKTSAIAYSPMLEAGGIDIISNGYDSNTPIFASVPSQAQHGLWTWDAVFLNMSKYVPDSFSVSATPSLDMQLPETGTYSNNTTVSYTCTYDYSYGFSETTRLSDIKQTYIPFTEALPNNAFNTFDANVVPYLLYNFSIDSPGLQFMNQSYDVFGPWNYYNPANSENLFPINTPSQFYISYGNELISGSENALASLGSFMAQLAGGLQQSVAPAYASGPISIAAIPNDYVFMLNTTGAGNYYINVLRLIPKGYYNMSGSQPNAVCQNESCQTQQAWDSAWNAYWGSAIATQNSTTYLINTLQLGNSGSLCGSLPSDEQQSCNSFVPLNISADYYGDVFVTGYTPYSIYSGTGRFISETGGQTPAMLEVKGAVGSSPQVIFQTYNSVPVLSEIASSPTGINVFAANASSGYIYEFAGNDLSYQGNFSLAYSQTNPITGEGTGVLNITDYLYKGGLFGVAFNGQGLAGNVMAYTKQGTGTEFDKASYHHPLGIADVNGYIYVLDNWAAALDWNDCILGYCHPATDMNMLVVRIVNVSGASVPANPVLFNDVWQQQACSVETGTLPTGCSTQTLTNLQSSVACSPGCEIEATGVCAAGGTGRGASQPGDTYACVNPGTKSSSYYSLATGSYAGNETYPPYGWVLSANVTTPDNQFTSFCSSSSCTYNTQDMNSAYPPIGPGLPKTYTHISGLGFSVNYNSTIDLILPKSAHNSGFGGICIPVLYCPQLDMPQYSELLTTSMNFENYTKLFSGYSPYECYTDSGNAACSQLPQISGMAGPVYSVDNPFYYLENQGAMQFLTLAGQFYSSLSPSELGGYKSSGSAPQLSVSQTPVGWGQTDIITATASVAADTVQIYIDGSQTPAAQGTGTTMYEICQTQPSIGDTNPGGSGGCLAPGQHTISAYQIASDGSTQSDSYTLTVQDTPYVSLQNNIETTGQGGIVPPDNVVAIAPSNAPDTLELVLPAPTGTVSGSRGAGSITYTICGGGGEWCPSGNTPAQYTIKAIDTSTGANSIATLYYVPASATSSLPSNLQVPVTLSSQVSGYLLVPYAYTYNLIQSYSPSVLTGASSNPDFGCPGYSAPGPASATVYTDALINAKSNTLSATVEGGNTYLQSLITGSYYEPNISDYGLIVPKNIQYAAQGNRLFGSVYANVSVCGTAAGPGGAGAGAAINCWQNDQALLNATEQLQYDSNEYALPNTGAYPSGYETLGEVPVSPAAYGQDLPVTSGATPALFASNTAALYYVNVQSPLTVPLFDIYRQAVYDSPLYLFLNGTTYTSGTGGGAHSLLGYQRIIYVLEDRFGNKLFAPVDMNVANPVEIQLSITPSVGSQNANSTLLAINGIAGTYSNFGTVFTPLPSGQQVYLYYGKDLNYVAYNPRVDPVNAIYCAYNVNGTPWQVSCTGSDPVSATNYANSNVVTYAADYNSMGVCNPPPNSLLAKNTNPCNVYGALGLSATCTPSYSGGPQRYCAPEYSNGTGYCTPQLGLFDIATVGSNGIFSSAITACGYGQESITAQYYGYPPPEPVLAYQPTLYYSENSVGAKAGQLNFATANVLNYDYAPNQTVSVFQIGLPLLGYGQVSAPAALAGIAAVLLVAYFLAGRRKRGKR